MIINFSVKNFKSIKDKIVLSFEASNSKDLENYYIINPTGKLRLLKLGLIYGANASGKTTILEALDFLRYIVLISLEKKTDIFDFKPFLFDNSTKNKNTLLSIEFVQNETKYSYNVELNKNAIIKEELYFFKPNKALVYKRDTNVSKQLAKIEFGSKIKIGKESKAALTGNTLWNNTVLAGYLKTNFESVELQEVTNWFKQKLKRLISPKTDLMGYISDKLESGKIFKRNLIELLKKADLGISDVNIDIKEEKVDKEFIKFLSEKSMLPTDEIKKIGEKGKITIREILFQHLIGNEKYVLEYGYESAGTKRYYQLSGLLNLMLSSDVIFPVDELESSLHPDLFKHFLLSFLVNSKKSQLIATTHHREFFMEKDIIRTDSIWFTERKSDGSTDLFSLDDFHSSVIRNTSSIYNAYKTGKLGATPDLSDYYIDLEDEKEKKK